MRRIAIVLALGLWAMAGNAESLQVGGRERTFHLYVPATTSAPMPLLLVLHGGGGNGQNMESLTKSGFNRIADRDHVLVAYPDGIGKGWNDGRSDLKSQAVKDNVDDVGFLRALVEELSHRYRVDRSRVYATGISNGGLMSYRLACDASDVFAAVAPVAATISRELAPECKPAKPVAISMMSGTEDPIMPWAGGPIKVLWMRRGDVTSVDDTFHEWLELDDCARPRIEPVIDRDTNDGTAIVLHVAQCKHGVEVRLYEVRGGGHTWPQGVPYLGPRIVGRVSQEIDANEEIWAFLKRFQRT